MALNFLRNTTLFFIHSFSNTLFAALNFFIFLSCPSCFWRWLFKNLKIKFCRKRKRRKQNLRKRKTWKYVNIQKTEWNTERAKEKDYWEWSTKNTQNFIYVRQINFFYFKETETKVADLRFSPSWSYLYRICS